MTHIRHTIKGLAEASIRVKDLDAMQQFYEEVIGLEVLRREDSYVFFKVAEGFGGHTQNFALFDAKERSYLGDKSVDLSSEQSTLHHIAFNVALEDFEPERVRLENRGMEVEAVDHAWIHLRSMYLQDPEGNTVELLAYDESVR